MYRYKPEATHLIQHNRYDSVGNRVFGCDFYFQIIVGETGHRTVATPVFDEYGPYCADES